MVRQVAASAAIPQYQFTRGVAVAAALELVSEVRSDWPDHPLRVTDLVIRALALAVDDVPEVNCRLADDHLIRRRTVDVNMLVAVGGELYNPLSTTFPDAHAPNSPRNVVGWSTLRVPTS
ncbi:MAG: hypothetical protein GEV07_07265 [Streptosporangiales bacterium]|nr:hypothetical protein [Streptosporangiales bacterium]